MKLVYIARNLLKQLSAVLACGLLTASITTYAEEVPMSSVAAAPATVTVAPTEATVTTKHKP